jgi:hypothetical protein
MVTLMITLNTLPRLQVKPVNLDKNFDSPDNFRDDTLQHILIHMCKDVNSDYSSVMKSLIHKNDIIGIIDNEVVPTDYSDHLSYLKDNMIYCFGKKFPHWQVDLKPELAAKKTFIANEIKCMETNRRFGDGVAKAATSAENSVLAIAQRKILQILGSCPSIQDIAFEFGPGATYSVKYNTSALDKLSSGLDCTTNCHGVAEEFLRSCPGWRKNSEVLEFGPPAPHKLNIVLGDRLSFVPKTAKTDRPIGIGPILNVLIQKGIGKHIRRRLKPCLDLRSAQEKHRSLARRASIDNSLATIDLKSASDTISYMFVQNMLPGDYFDLMDQVRSQNYCIEDKWYHYHKFSAMGNGFTFELESLLFYSLAIATCYHLGLSTDDVSVYGDDIIIPQSASTLLSKVLSLCGFDVNSEKSFTDGPFRESCGGDYFLGHDVRPFYLKDKVTYRTIFLFHNFLVKKGLWLIFKGTYRFIRRLLGKDICFFFKTWNDKDDGALLSYNEPIGSYNRVVPHPVGQRRNSRMKLYGYSYTLYRCQFITTEPSESEDIPWYKTRKFRVRYRLYRHVHI